MCQDLIPGGIRSASLNTDSFSVSLFLPLVHNYVYMRATLFSEIKQLKLQKTQYDAPRVPWKSSDNSEVRRCQNEVAQASGLEQLTCPTEPGLWVVLAGSPNQTASPSPQGPRSHCSSWGISSSNSILTCLDATLSLPPEIRQSPSKSAKVRLYPIVLVPTLPFNLNHVCFLVATSLRY